jgi:hypothetical protein
MSSCALFNQFFFLPQFPRRWGAQMPSILRAGMREGFARKSAPRAEPVLKAHNHAKLFAMPQEASLKSQCRIF